MDVGASFVADDEASEPVDPGEAALDDPAMVPELLAALHTSPCNSVLDAPTTARLAAPASIVDLVRVQPVGSAPWSTPLASDGGHGVDQLLKGYAVVDCWRRSAGRRAGRHERSVIRWRLVPGLPRSVGLGPVASPPPLAAMDELSRQARLQSMRSASRSRRSSSRCRRSQTPAACQSRSLRQQVTPEPHSISCGSLSQGMPVHSTNRIPVSAARAGTGGRPPRGRAGSGSSRGSMIDHNASGRRGARMRPHEPRDETCARMGCGGVSRVFGCRHDPCRAVGAGSASSAPAHARHARLRTESGHHQALTGADARRQLRRRL